MMLIWYHRKLCFNYFSLNTIKIIIAKILNIFQQYFKFIRLTFDCNLKDIVKSKCNVKNCMSSTMPINYVNIYKYSTKDQHTNTPTHQYTLKIKCAQKFT